MSTRPSGNYERRRARPGTSPRARKREREILEAGVTVFAEKGYVEASTEDIGAEVGMLRGSLYYYIRSKEELLYRILLDTHEHYLAQIRDLREDDAPAMDRLRETIRRHILNSEDPRLHKLYVSEFRHLSGARKREIMDMRLEYQRFFNELIEAAQREGDCVDDLDAEAIASVILHNINSLVLANAGSEEDRRAFAAVADRFVVKALTPDAAQPR